MKHKGPVDSARFSRDGQRVVTASWDNTAQLWDAASGKAIGEPMQHRGIVNSAEFSPDGRRVVTACDARKAVNGESKIPGQTAIVCFPVVS